MVWDFETDPEFQAKLDRMQSIVDETVEPLGHLGNRPALALELYPDPLGDIQDAAEAVA